MEWFEALILGLIQGLTEYLPVSSSGHLAIGSALFDIKGEDNLAFTIVVHVATVFSTLVILWKELRTIPFLFFYFSFGFAQYCIYHKNKAEETNDRRYFNSSHTKNIRFENGLRRRRSRHQDKTDNYYRHSDGE